MRLGIDFGTTRTVVAWADRGNYPVVEFDDAFGDAVDHLPTVAAWTEHGPVFGFAALAAARTGAPQVRSFKRLLTDPELGFDSEVAFGHRRIRLVELITGFAAVLNRSLRVSSSLSPIEESEPLQVMLGVPAQASTAQRMITLEALTRAGFTVEGMINEPSAAAFEYSHRYPRTLTSRRSDVIVFDLGGGTFDASLVRVEGRDHRILASVGDPRLGGDDFDQVLAGLAAEAGGTQVGPGSEAELLDDARAAKEQIAPQTKRVTLEVAEQPVTVAVDDFYRAAGPLVERAVQVMEPLLGGSGPVSTEETELAGIYLVGGASGLPLVPRTLRERFGRRVHRSPHASGSTAIGLAIAADPDSGYRLFDKLTRGIGVFREAEGGKAIAFDLVVAGSTELPEPGDELVITRRYRAAHDLGHFRFVEVAGVDGAGEPVGDLSPLAELTVPFDPRLRDGRDLAEHQPSRTSGGPQVEERYRIDANRVVEIRVTDLDTGYHVEAVLGGTGAPSSVPRPA
ncbi:Hsp70 family protein [Naumannella halotolerans]|nr:Hsp70 family protein [Naumannella halotolerans]